MKVSVLQAALQVFGSGPYDAGISVDAFHAHPRPLSRGSLPGVSGGASERVSARYCHLKRRWFGLL